VVLDDIVVLGHVGVSDSDKVDVVLVLVVVAHVDVVCAISNEIEEMQ
jgi:hypothetical protein